MTELSGMLDGLGLTAIVRFLSGLHKSGCLRLAQDDWHGEVYFDDGRLTCANLGTRTGLQALDALIEVLPVASFSFDSQATRSGEPTIDLDNDSLLAHLDEVAARVASGKRSLPPADAVPSPTTAENGTEEPVQLDRATLQTLLGVDGQRTVREIVTRRGSFDALWHLGTLLNAGLIELGPPRPAAPAVVEPPSPGSLPVTAPSAAVMPPVAPVLHPQVAEIAPPSPEAAAAMDAHCPKLGFEDDPASSFGRPTRLHRCFAIGRPLPLSLDQQRELCLSDQFGTCPRLAGILPNQPGRVARPASPRPEVAAQSTDEPRIVRLPVTGRPTPPEREVPSNLAHEPRPLRPVAPIGAHQDAPPPTPLRARLNRAASVAVDAPVPRPVAEAAPAPRQQREVAPPAAALMDAGAPERRFGSLPLVAIPVIGVAILIAVGVMYLLPQLDALFGDNSIDPATLPNTSLVEAGTPVANLGLSRVTPVALRATPSVPADVPDATVQPTAASSQPTPGANTLSQPTSAAAQQTAAPDVAGVSTGTSAIFDERFTSNDAGWPSNPVGTALMTNGTYRIATRQAGQFAAVSAPVANVPGDVVISATFRKLAGPAGGGYGIIVRDQEPTLRDGTSQDGHYYVLEAGDKGEVGIWRRDGDHWVDLLPWQHTDAVKTGSASNELTVRAVGNTLSLSVNGTPVATRTDGSFGSGKAGLFVGGDGNQVAVSRFTLQAP
jgi:hypothetical protein